MGINARSSDGRERAVRRRLTACRSVVACSLAVACFLVLAPVSLAGLPVHLHKASLDLSGFNHACGTAVDSKGDVYVASAGESKVRIFDAEHHELFPSITNAEEPCGLAVDSSGNLYVSESKAGKVVKYHPTAYPFVGAPAYEAPVEIDKSGFAKGIAVDPHDDRLYVAEDSHIAVYKSDGSFEANVGVGEIKEATGVAAYTYVKSKVSGEFTRYLFVADVAGGEADRVELFSGIGSPEKPGVTTLKERREITGPRAGESFGFGGAGAYLAVDPGNRSEEKCASVAEQACTSGHFLVYDSAHSAVDEFEASGEFLDQLTDPAFADAKPTAMAVDRSGGANDGTIYVTSGESAGAKVLAFAPLAPPSRAPRPELSRVLKTASAVTTDSYGDVYVRVGGSIHIFAPTGEEIKVGPKGEGFQDEKNPENLAVDSVGNVYVLDVGNGSNGEFKVTYYTPTNYPPASGTTYTRHEPPIAVDGAGWPEFCPTPFAVAVNPSNDHFFVTSGCTTHEYDSAADGSALLNDEFAEKLPVGIVRSIAVDGDSGDVYLANGSNQSLISVVNSQGTEVLARITGAGAPQGKFDVNPHIAVDQANGHVLEYDLEGEAREYDATGAFVTGFGNLVKGGKYAIAVDSACAIHKPPLSGSACELFDPANGSAYVVTSSPVTQEHPFNLNAFDPLTYGEAPLAVTGMATGLGAGGVTLNGTLNPNGSDVSKCAFEYLGDAEYKKNEEEEEPLFQGATSISCAQSLAEIGKGNKAVAVDATIASLPEAEGRYRFRLVAANKYGESEGKAALFGPPVIAPKSAQPILYHEATLRGEIDPSGLQTEYHFEYLTQAQYEENGESFSGASSTPTATLPASAGISAVEVPLLGLEEGVIYRFRLIAENEDATVTGPDQILTTLQRRLPESCPNAAYRSGLSANLADCRAYELTTPAETNGLSPVAPPILTAGEYTDPGFNNWLAVPRGTAAGERLSYYTNGTLPGFDGNGVNDVYRAERGAGEHPAAGWQSTLAAPSYQDVVPDFAQGHMAAPESFGSDQLYSFWLVHPGPGATLPEGIYLRTPAGFEPVGKGSMGVDPKADGRYVSPGGAHVIFRSKAHLEEGAAPEGTLALYDRPAGAQTSQALSLPPDEKTQVLSLNPDGEPFGAGENAFYLGSTEDGTAVVFQVGGVLYLSRGGQTTEVADAPNTFAGIAEDGKRVFYVAATYPPEKPAPAGLFACDTAQGPCAGPKASQKASKIASAGIFAALSSDGSHAFFSSEDPLTPEAEENEAGQHAVAGQHNLFSWDAEAETTRFIARLDAHDFEHAAFAGIPGMNLASWTTAVDPGTVFGRALAPLRATPNGSALLFQSHAQLTAYDNEGKGEIYRYMPGAEAGGRLLCISCDPSGAPPSADALLEDIHNVAGVNASTVIANITDDGARVFFQSADRLLPEDANEAVDVYEWQAKGSGGCTRDGGCLALISSGQGESNSYLYAMSADGRDVFFRTPEKLVGADVPGSSSIYDAREGGGIPEVPAPAPCQGDACQGQGGEPPVLPSAATTGSGEGNEAPKAPGCAKGRHRVKGRCVPVKKHHHRRRHRRAGARRGAGR
jgi:hypothetical protein